MIIYKITNNINNKVYIGKTKNTLEKRWKQHCSKARRNRSNAEFQKAILEFGPESFRIEQIDVASTDEEACLKEIHWIEHFDCIYPKGYNVSKGGTNGGNYTRIKNVTTGEEFDSMLEASKKYNRHIQAIHQALDKPNRTCAGCKWERIVINN